MELTHPVTMDRRFCVYGGMCILTSTTCVLKYRDRDPVHLQLIRKETRTEEGSGSIRLGCSSVLTLPPAAALLHGGKHEKTEGNEEAINKQK